MHAEGRHMHALLLLSSSFRYIKGVDLLNIFSNYPVIYSQRQTFTPTLVLLLKTILFVYYLFICGTCACVCVRPCVCLCQGVHVKDQGELAGVSSLLPCRSQGQNSGHQDCAASASTHSPILPGPSLYYLIRTYTSFIYTISYKYLKVHI